MLFSFVRSLFSGDSYSIGSALLQIAAVAFVVVFTMPVHEAAHAWMASRLGDDTGRMHGRLTLNPRKHIDWLGALLLLLVGFGYAKPVPVNVRNFKKPQRDMALTAFAGPVSNLCMGLLCTFLYAVLLFLAVREQSDALNMTADFFYFAASINVSLAVFNLLPIPPLDGSRLLTALLPQRIWYRIIQYEQYIRYGLLALLFFGVLTKPLMFLTGLVMDGYLFLAGLPFRALG
ncbi:MAG: site-2 protease family protein [Oscillospiraceae bacterium]|jgi:Zn-dependent protease|nr:site-2 protease family protein [Oscillospiraceae bacterium]